MKDVTSEQEQRRLAALARYDILDTLPEQAFDRITNLVARLFDAPIALVSLVDEHRQWFKACVGLDVRETDRSLSFCAHAIRHDDVMVVLDATLDPRFADNLLVTGHPRIRFYAGAPLVTPDGFKLGTLCVIDDQPRRTFTKKERATLVDLAALVMDELELRTAKAELRLEAEAKARALDEVRAVAYENEALLGVTTLLQLDLPPADVTMRALAFVAQAADIDWCNLTAIRGDEAWMEAVWSKDASGDVVTSSLPPRQKRGVGLVWTVLEQGHPRFISKYDDEPTAIPTAVRVGFKAAACLPLGEYDGISYVVVFARLHLHRPWTERDERLLEAAAHSIRYALRTREHLRLTREAALTDLLTGLGNRRAFEEALRAASKDFLVVAVDLDGLKVVNDTLGHAAGDGLLRVFTSALSANLPAGASAFRVGGDEFAVLVPDVSLKEQTESAKAEVNEALEAAVLSSRKAGFGTAGASFGVAQFPREARTPKSALRLADQRLYEHKRARRRDVHPGGTPDSSAVPTAETTPRPDEP